MLTLQLAAARGPRADEITAGNLSFGASTR